MRNFTMEIFNETSTRKSQLSFNFRPLGSTGDYGNFVIYYVRGEREQEKLSLIKDMNRGNCVV